MDNLNIQAEKRPDRIDRFLKKVDGTFLKRMDTEVGCKRINLPSTTSLLVIDEIRKECN